MALTFSKMNPFHLAVHEASHAVAGICVGRQGKLKKISIVPNDMMKGGCHWDIPTGKCSGIERDQEIFIGLAGPVGQVLFAIESLASHHSTFQESVLQDIDQYNEADCAGWASTDLEHYLQIKTYGYPISEFQELEKLTRDLLSRETVSSVIHKLARKLEDLKEIEGSEAEELILKNLSPNDLVGIKYLE